MMFLELNDTERDRITEWNGTRPDRINYGDGWGMRKKRCTGIPHPAASVN